MLTEMPDVEWIRYMKSHNSGTKNYTTIIRTYWATKYASWIENEFWATYHYFKFVRWMLTSSLKLNFVCRNFKILSKR